MKGFTLIEILIVTAFTALLLVFVVPTSLRFFQTQNLVDATNTLIASLRDMQNKAVFQKNDSDFGVKFSANSYILFQGSTYASRTTSEDVTIMIPSNVSISGIDEIVFAKRTGFPNTTGVLLVQTASKEISVSINNRGVIELL